MTAFKVDFIGIGAFRSGTSWIAQVLREHPEICVPHIKEIEFFSKYYQKGMSWYESQFTERGGPRVRGEYSNSYLCDEDAPKRIKKHFPEAKLVVCLRNPVDRAYSHYWWGALNFNKDAGIDEYLEEGFYHRYLVRWFDLFSQEKIHIILFDNIESRPGTVVRDLYEFLGVDSSFVPPSLGKKVNPAAKVRFRFLVVLFKLRKFLEKAGLGGLIDFLKRANLYNRIQRLYVMVNRKEATYPPMSRSERERLRKVFRKDIESLEKLIGRDLRGWK